MAQALDRVLQALNERDCRPKSTGSSWKAMCPAHEDQQPSLSVTEGEGGRVLLKCFAGCKCVDVIAALGLEMADLFPSREHAAGAREPVTARYVYCDEAGTTLFRVCRTEAKAFFQERFDAGVWRPGLKGTRRVLYHLPAVMGAVSEGARVYVVEGEKDVDQLAAVGLVATTSPMGAGKWRPEYTTALTGARVVVLPDNDQPDTSTARKWHAHSTGFDRRGDRAGPARPARQGRRERLA